MENSEGSTEKVEYRYTTTTTNLLLCNVTIIVLKITLHHSISVITNFIIPKHDKKDKKHYIFSSTAGAGPKIPSILGTVIEVCAIFATPNIC